MTLAERLERRGNWFKVMLWLLLLAAVGTTDWALGYELSFSLFYLGPIVFATWFLGRRSGLAAAVLSALVWLWADIAAGHPYSNTWILLWNTLIRFSLFAIIATLLSLLRESVERKRSQARIDALTGAVNARHFAALVRRELDRLQRYGRPFTVAYIDLDNFQVVNDRWGHAAGDRVLRSVALCARDNLRKVDVVARLGGDEFAILLSETGEQAAKTVAEKLRAELQQEFCRSEVPITLSIGVLICIVAPATVDDLISAADGLMFAAKRSGKNTISYWVHG